MSRRNNNGNGGNGPSIPFAVEQFAKITLKKHKK